MSSNKREEAMHVFKQQSHFYQENKSFLLRSYTSKEQFVRDYTRLYYGNYCGKAKAEELYILLLFELEKAVSEGNIDSFKKLSNLIDYISDIEDQLNLRSYYDNANNPIKTTNLVILACKHNEVKILEYLLSNDCKIVSNLSIGIRKAAVLPDDEDEAGHNVFYYAMRSGNVELLDTLIKKWPNNSFTAHSRELDEILSKAYGELKLKNVPLSDKIEIFVENELINLHFFSNTSEQDKNAKNDLNCIRERIDLVLQNINLLKIEYLNVEKVDNKFLFILNFIAQNVHILKRQLKSSYIRLPWEEIEFYLICFVSQTKEQGINLFYHDTVNKGKMLSHLENFAKRLEDEKDNIQGINVNKLADLPKLRRDEVVAEIISKYPEFEELYKDYKQIRDAHSLEKISDYITLALSADPQKREGHLIITRVLQIIGEYLKNTLESPKLSSTTNEFLLLSIPRNTREIIIDLRNSSSHAYSLSKRTEIEENRDAAIFIGVQNDIKKIGSVVIDIYCKHKLKMIIIFLKKIIDSENINEIKEIAGVLCNVNLDDTYPINLHVLKCDYLEELVKELSRSIPNKSDIVTELFSQIHIKINSLKNPLEGTSVIRGFIVLETLINSLRNIKSDNIGSTKYHANVALMNMAPKTKSHIIKEIVELAVIIFHNINLTTVPNNDEIHRLFCEIFYIAEIDINDIKWIGALRERLNEKGSFIPMYNHEQSCNLTEEKYNNNLALKVSELTHILNSNALSGQLTEQFPSYKRNKKLQAVIEILVLDIMSILDSSNHCLENNLFFLDDNTPLLIGKCLRDYLAYDNALANVLLTDSSIAVIVNARKLAEENITSEKKIGKLVVEDISKLKVKYIQGLATITNQERMFAALEEGNMEDLQNCVKQGADINAVSANSWTALHFAAKGPSLEVLKFILDQNLNVNAKDINGQNPLHIAATYGRTNIVEFFIKEARLHINGLDHKGKTPLHVATQNGHKDTVQVLLKNKANANVANVTGITPLHFAVENGHLEIVTVLLKHGVNIQARDKYNLTPLHCAAESGHKEIAELLIRNKAEINAKSTSNNTPLHVAALKGKENTTQLLLKNKAKVDARDIHGRTPLHVAAMSGNSNVIYLLIQNKAEVNARTNDGMTPLYAAVTAGHKNIVNILIDNKAQVNVRSIENGTPLHIAVDEGHKEIVEILIANGAKIDAERDNETPLCYAIKYSYMEIVEVLLANGANVNTGGPLLLAAFAGYRDIVEILLNNKARVNKRSIDNTTALHVAASRGHKEIVNTLIRKRANVNAATIANETPLHAAAQKGYKEIVEILIKKGARVNVKTNYGITPLHIAAIGGYSNVVKVLLDNEANISIKDKMNRTALVFAVKCNSLQVVKMLLQYKKGDMNAKYCNDCTILHIASQQNNLEMVKYLVDEGCDINARNSSGSKPIHVAAGEGHTDIIEFFLSTGLSINEPDADNLSLLHYAAMNGCLEVVKYLIAQGADINIQDKNGLSPMHIAANLGHKDIIEILLKNGAICNAIDKFYRTPLQMAGDRNIIHLLLLTEKLTEAVKCNNCTEVESCIKAGASVNAKHSGRGTLLHYAAWKGYDKIVNILLENKCDPNAINDTGFTPLHYAAKFSHLKVVKALLFHGAVYNAVSNTGKIPSDLTTDENITSLLKLISDLFKNIENGDSRVIDDLKTIKSVETIKAIRGAHNRENQTLVVAAMRSNFSKVERLKEILEDDVSDQINMASVLLEQGNYKRALSIFKSAFEKRKEILGSNNPGTLDVQANIAEVFYAQGSYQEALNILEAIFEKQKEMLGLNAKDTLKTRSTIGLVLHRQGRDEEALNTYQEIYEQQKEILGSNHSDTLDTQFHMALILDKLGRYEDAFIINKTVFEKREKILGAHHPDTVSAQNNIAMVLSNQGKYKEALKIYDKILEKKWMLLGINHSDTLKTLHNIAGVLVIQKKYDEALKVYQDVLNSQKNVLGLNHPDTLNTQYDMANVLFAQQKWTSALEVYKEIFPKRKSVFGPNHPTVLDTLKKMEVIHSRFKFQGYKESEVLEYLQKDINVAARNGDIQAIQCLLNNGTDINAKDADGRTPLHYAINNQHIHVINFLVENGADVTQATNKGNTPLHTAALKGHKEIIEVLLQHTNQNKLNDFINARTIASGSTALHVAAQGGFPEIVKCLLKHGAIYSIENKEGKTPLNLAKDQSIIGLLKLIEELFEDASKGNVEIISKLKTLKPDEFVAVTSAHNNQENTLLQIATTITRRYEYIESHLVDMLKKLDQ